MSGRRPRLLGSLATRGMILGIPTLDANLRDVTVEFYWPAKETSVVAEGIEHRTAKKE